MNDSNNSLVTFLYSEARRARRDALQVCETLQATLETLKEDLESGGRLDWYTQGLSCATRLNNAMIWAAEQERIAMQADKAAAVARAQAHECTRTQLVNLIRDKSDTPLGLIQRIEQSETLFQDAGKVLLSLVLDGSVRTDDEGYLYLPPAEVT